MQKDAAGEGMSLRPLVEYRQKVLKPFFEPYRANLRTDLYETSPYKGPSPFEKRTIKVPLTEDAENMLLYVISKDMVALDILMRDDDLIPFVTKHWIEIMSIMDNTLNYINGDKTYSNPVIYFTEKNMHIIIKYWTWFIELPTKNARVFLHTWRNMDFSTKYNTHNSTKEFFDLMDENIQWFIDNKLFDARILNTMYFVPILEKHFDLINTNTTIPWCNMLYIRSDDDDRIFNIIKRVDKAYWSQPIVNVLMLGKYENLAKLIKYHWNYFVDNNIITWERLCENEIFINILIDKFEWLVENNKIDWQHLCRNSNAVDIINGCWNALFINNVNNQLIKDRLFYLMGNKHAVAFYHQHIDDFNRWNEMGIQWTFNVYNFTRDTVSNYDFYNFYELINANWDTFIRHKNIDINSLLHYSKYINLIILHWDQYYKEYVTNNHLDKILNNLQGNPAIYYDEYEVACREYFRRSVAEELMAHVWHPKNISRFAELGYATDA